MNNQEADFGPLPEGYSLERQPLTDAKLAELKALFRTSKYYDTPRDQPTSRLRNITRDMPSVRRDLHGEVHRPLRRIGTDLP